MLLRCTQILENTFLKISVQKLLSFTIIYFFSSFLQSPYSPTVFSELSGNFEKRKSNHNQYWNNGQRSNETDQEANSSCQTKEYLK